MQACYTCFIGYVYVNHCSNLGWHILLIRYSRCLSLTSRRPRAQLNMTKCIKTTLLVIRTCHITKEFGPFLKDGQVARLGWIPAQLWSDAYRCMCDVCACYLHAVFTDRSQLSSPCQAVVRPAFMCVSMRHVLLHKNDIMYWQDTKPKDDDSPHVPPEAKSCRHTQLFLLYIYMCVCVCIYFCFTVVDFHLWMWLRGWSICTPS